MIDFSTLQGLTIPEGVVTQIADASGRVLWAVQSGGKVILQVEKITADTYAAETTYTGEQFILLDIYPKTNGTVKVTYGGLTKTITDTSGAEEPNAQQVYFGTFNGVSDSVTTPASGALTIEGDYYAFGQGGFSISAKASSRCDCVTSIISFGSVTVIALSAFGNNLLSTALKDTVIEIPKAVSIIHQFAFINCDSLQTVIIGEGVESIGRSAFDNCDALKTVKILSHTPPTLTLNGVDTYQHFGNVTSETCVLEEIIVPKGCVATYKAAEGWSTYADYITEAS